MNGWARSRSLVLVVDDDADARAGMCALLERDGHESLGVANGDEALAAVAERRPDLVLLDICLPAPCGYEICRLLRSEFGDALPILFVSESRKESYDRVAALLVGGDDFVSKPVPPDEFLARVRRLIVRASSGEPRSLSRVLTPRELEVLRLLARGLSQNEIAQELVLSPKTVGTHIEHVLKKLNVRTRAQAVALAHRENLAAEARV